MKENNYVDKYQKYLAYKKNMKSCTDYTPALRLDQKINFSIDELNREAFLNMEYVGETIEAKAKEILNMYKFKFETKNFYAYLMREVMRNVIEHSEAKDFSAFIYSNVTQFGFKIVDRGIGIKKSLELNPYYSISNDMTALLLAIKPGISRSYKRDPYRDDIWQNSGFGLYMVSSIINKIGTFEIASGNSSIVIKNGFIQPGNAKIKGTEVVVVINTGAKINIRRVIKEVSQAGSEFAKNSPSFSELAKIKTASQASTLLNSKI